MPETRTIVLPDAEDRTIVFSFFWTGQNTPCTDTDGQTQSYTITDPTAVENSSMSVKYY